MGELESVLQRRQSKQQQPEEKSRAVFHLMKHIFKERAIQPMESKRKATARHRGPS